MRRRSYFGTGFLLHAWFITMPAPVSIVKGPPNEISVLELKRLMIDLKEKRPDILIRYRLLGELWAKNFMRIRHVTERGVMLNDEPANKLFIIPNLSYVMQFEIDNRFQNFEPHFHYEIKAGLNSDR